VVPAVVPALTFVFVIICILLLVEFRQHRAGPCPLQGDSLMGLSRITSTRPARLVTADKNPGLEIGFRLHLRFSFGLSEGTTVVPCQGNAKGF
jgi:hypothetical protein